MSPIALTSPSHTPGGGKSEISRRPSPWIDLAHSLSETSLTPSHYSTSASSTPIRTSGPSPTLIPSPSPPLPEAQLSSSALREWDRLLSESSGQARRHHLNGPRHASSSGSLSAPKLAAERDKDGHIEYKLKLIDPTPDRFERLVTQMLWRLKQGRNEAIYEIGLADDGTVIGLTRAEMDASLHTLEQMAAEVGATVLILKEIVISSLPPPSASGTSSFGSTSAPSSADGWMVRRPDLDEWGMPRKGSRSLSSAGGGTEWAGKSKAGKVWKDKGRGVEKQIVFDQADIDGDDGEDPSFAFGVDAAERMEKAEEAEEDVPQFHLDLDIPPSVPLLTTIHRPRKWRRPPQPQPIAPPPISPEVKHRRQIKSLSKAARSAERREARRLELYKGDGTNPMWIDRLPSHSGLGPRLSTLRLPPSAAPSSGTSPTDPFLAELLHVPLDNLSLSFADVRTVNLPSSACLSWDEMDNAERDGDDDAGAEDEDDLGSLTEYATSPPPSASFHRPGPDDLDWSAIPPAGGGTERICVEALVVRKTAEGVAGVVEWCGEDGDDVWGFGEGDEEDGEVDPDDGWGLEG